MGVFTSPKIVYGVGSVKQIKEFIDDEAEKAMIVTDSGIVDLGIADDVRENLENAGLEVKIFDEVEPDPSVSTAEKGGELMIEFEPDWIVGLGGGSCMDAAKAMQVKYVHPEADLSSINPIQKYGLREKANLLTIPTTSGTGADSTWAVVLTDEEKDVKLGLATREVVADIALLNPSFPKNMPKKLTAGSGMDVLGHAVGGYIAAGKNDFSDGMCLQAIRLAMEYLPRAVESPDDMKARKKMHYAATMAGLGFGNSQAALEHSIGHAVGAVYHLHHGMSVGVALPYTIQFAGRDKRTRRLFSEIASLLDIDYEDWEDAGYKLADELFDLLETNDLPKSFSEIEISEEEWEDNEKKVLRNALGDTCTSMSPRHPSREEMRKLIDYCWKGKKVDF